MFEALIRKLEELDQRTTTIDVTVWADAADDTMRQAAMALRHLRIALEDIRVQLQQVKELTLS